jgi:hypothetical protein
VERIFGKRPWVSRMDELMNENKKVETEQVETDANKADTETEQADSEKTE